MFMDTEIAAECVDMSLVDMWWTSQKIGFEDEGYGVRWVSGEPFGAVDSYF